jgi:hypothetical protein
MPQTARVTFFFEGANQGWSESYIFPVGDSVSPSVAYATIFSTIAQLRAQCLASQYTLTVTRVAIIYDNTGAPVKRNADPFIGNYKSTTDPTVNSGEQPNACALLTWKTATGNRRKKAFMGGVPDEIFTDAGKWVPGGAANWGSRFSAWNAAMIAAGAGWLEDVPSGPSKLVQSVTDEANGTHVYTTTGNLFGAPDIGQQRSVRVKGVNGKSVYNGPFEVIVNALNIFQTIDSFAAFGYERGGVATAYVFPKPAISAAVVNVTREGTHKRGRPGEATRGRLLARPRG